MGGTTWCSREEVRYEDFGCKCRRGSGLRSGDRLFFNCSFDVGGPTLEALREEMVGFIDELFVTRARRTELEFRDARTKTGHTIEGSFPPQLVAPRLVGGTARVDMA